MNLIKIIKDYVSRNQHRPFARKIRNACHDIYMEFEHTGYSIETNGEAEVVRKVIECGGTNFFDVGANVGDWSLAVLKRMKVGKVYAFEAIPQTREILRRNINSDKAQISHYGLFSSNRDITMFYCPGKNVKSGINPVKDMENIEMDIQVITGDFFMNHFTVPSVCMMKIDVEGAEREVLVVFSNAFLYRQIEVVQFEFHEGNFNEYIKFFEGYGFRVGKIYPRYVDFDNISSMPKIVGPNFLAVREDKKTLIKYLSKT